MSNSKLKVKSEKLKVSGFGLIETLIACGIVAMLGAASVGLSNSIIRDNRLSYQKMVATNLASEAIEVAHWIRDKNVTDADSATEWSSSRNSALSLNSCVETDPCGISPSDRTSLGSTVQDFKYDSQENTIVVDNVTYIRKVFVNLSGNELNITVQVEVNNNPLAKISTVLTNWK